MSDLQNFREEKANRIETFRASRVKWGGGIIIKGNHVAPLSRSLPLGPEKTKRSAARTELQSPRSGCLSGVPSRVGGGALTSHRGRPPHSPRAGRALIHRRCLRCEPGRRRRGSALLRGISNEPENRAGEEEDTQKISNWNHSEEEYIL